MLKLLEKSGVFVHLDPRREGVAVPSWFKNQPELVLQVGLNMAVPIRDLEVDDDGVFCTLSFSRSPFYCRLPWHAIFGLLSDEDRRGVVWASDAPPESSLAQARPTKPKPRPHLRAVGADEPNEEVHDPPERAVLGGAGDTCVECGTRFPEDGDSCAVCGADRGLTDESKPAEETAEESKPDQPDATEAGPRLVASELETEASAEGDSPEPPDPDGPPKKSRPPYLRLVK
jgi:stringent starvation protein B